MHPELFRLPGLDVDVHSYGFFVGLGLILGWFLSLRLAAADRLPTEPLGTAYVLAVASGLFAARAGYLVQDPGRIDGWVSFVQLQAGGLAPFLGIAVGCFVAAWLGQRAKVPVLAWLDVAVAGLLSTLVLERVGAWLAGTGFGSYADPGLPWAVRFPAGSPAFVHHQHKLAALLPPHATESLSVHPVQLYGMAAGLLGIGLLWWLRTRRRFSGECTLLVLIWVVASRSLLEEWFRADREPPVLGPFNAGQVGGVAMIVVLLGILRLRASMARADAGALRQWLGGPWSPKGA